MKPGVLKPVLLAMLVIAAFGQAQTMRVAQLGGSVTLVAAGKPAVILNSGDKLNAGDEVVTGMDSSVLLKLSDGSTVEVFPSTRVLFQDPRHSVWTDFLEVLLGTVKIHVEKLSGRPNPKSVTTPTAIIAVRGTIFDVQVDQEATTQVGVEEGLVSVANLQRSGEVMLQPGFRTTVERGQPPAAPTPRQSASPVAPASRFGPAGGAPGPTADRSGPDRTSPSRNNPNQSGGQQNRPQSMPPSTQPPRRPGGD